MDKDTANALIQKIWSIEERLTSVRSDLEAIELAIADQVQDC
mgnify:CR=1 FL=1